MKRRGPDGRYLRTPMGNRFWEKVDKRGPDECWPWIGSREWNGYGRLTDYWAKHLAHRYAYTLLVGPIPPGKNVCHTCDNPPCVNPAHLWVGTQTENLTDRSAKGRNGTATPNPTRGTAAPNHKLTDKQVAAIRAAYVPRKVTVRDLAAQYGVAHSLIHRIVKGESWSHV